MGIYTLMSGNNNLVGAAVRIAKSPDEVFSLLAKHTLTIELGKAPRKRQESLLRLTDLLLLYPEHLSEDSVYPIVRAMADKNEDVAVTADVCVMTVSTDSPGIVFSTLLKEAKKAKGDVNKRMGATVISLYALASEKEKTNLLQLAWRHKFKPLIKRESIFNSMKVKSKKGNIISLNHLKPKPPAKQVMKIRRVA